MKKTLFQWFFVASLMFTIVFFASNNKKQYRNNTIKEEFTFQEPTDENFKDLEPGKRLFYEELNYKK